MLKKDSVIIYVGKTNRGISRIIEHNKTKEFDSYIFWPAPPDSLDIWEKVFIDAYNPTLNQINNNLKKIMYKDALNRPRWKYANS